jgi:hypothetical protein
MDWALKERLEIARIIRAENLSNGYAFYGNGLSTNFVMNEQRVAAIRPKSKEPMLWAIDKNTFYRPGKFDFVIAWKNNQGDWWNHDWNDKEIQENFGKPQKIIDSGRVRLYIYEDITDKVTKPELR